MATSLKKIMGLFAREEEGAPCRETDAAGICFLVAATVLFFFFADLFFASVVFLFHGPVSLIVFWISAACAVGFAFFYSRINFQRYVLCFFLALIVALALFVASIALNRPIYDISYDGQTYQQEAVIQLSNNGWDPVYQYLDPAVIGADQKWIDYYPKATWVIESSLHLLTHDEQAAKAPNIVLIAVSIALLYVAFTDTGMLKKRDAAIVSILLGCNPVSILESLSFYVDGQLMSLLLCLIAAFLIMYAGKRRYAVIIFFAIIPFFINIKFTAVVDAVILLFGFLLFAWVKRRELLFVKLFLVGFGAIVLGGLLIGASPYLTNLVRYHEPFYPLYGAGSIDLKPYNVPGNFIDKNSLEILFLSFFSRSGGVKGVGTVSAYKLPFTYSADELPAFHYPDPDEGGFGPLFGGAVIFAALMMAYAYYASGKSGHSYRRRFWMAFLIILFVIAMSAVNPISSLARYVPQAYLIAIIPIILLLSLDGKLAKTIAYCGIVLLGFNFWLIAQSYVSYNLTTSGEITAELQNLKTQSLTAPVLVYFNEFKSTRVMLQEAGIAYATTDDPSACPTGFKQALPENTTEFCVTQ